jgi:glutathionyl-hydroquinone reductase
MSTYLDIDNTPDLLSQEEIDALVPRLLGNVNNSVYTLSYEQIQAFLERPDIASLLVQLTAVDLTVSRLNEILHTLIREVVTHTEYWGNK